ncbi:hypothetical protein F4813DRAFT_363582 [Daldinia decipiens]|uniref:uncharacterized protein n=1 Tax=Daldinia decipiens TaxID=326647 RepID=UPI0020C289B3|nr:uncharacterized protein F4813DRAFT_363582 [Daldinia decipiens]KAI1656538.1 hypothetical protein F4813DRAFT_363582 [Daldinia decipiens]
MLLCLSLSFPSHHQTMAAAPSLNSLPYEVRQTIYSLVARQTNSNDWRKGPVSTIAHYATVSREWQEEFVEPITFKAIRVTPRRLKSFCQIVTSPRRRAIVQTICFHVSLDKYDSRLDGEPETPAERRRSTEILTMALGTFFRAMTQWQKSDTSPLGLDLHLRVDSPSDASSLASRNGGALVTGRALTSCLELDLDVVSLPHIDVFGGFRCTGRHLQPTSILFIVSRLQTLEYLDVELNHDSTRNRDVKQRNSFALGLQNSETIRVLCLRRPSPMLTPVYAPPKQPWSAFYDHMRTFSQQCESFEFDDCIDAVQFFTPFLLGSGIAEPPKGQEAPFFPRLKRLNVRNSYMMKSPYLRVTNRVEALASVRNLLAAIGRATRRMPALLFVRVCQYVLTDARLEWFVLIYEYHADKVVMRTKGFRPGKLIANAWRESAAEKGTKLIIHHEKDDLNTPEL